MGCSRCIELAEVRRQIVKNRSEILRSSEHACIQGSKAIVLDEAAIFGAFGQLRPSLENLCRNRSQAPASHERHENATTPMLVVAPFPSLDAVDDNARCCIVAFAASTKARADVERDRVAPGAAK